MLMFLSTATAGQRREVNDEEMSSGLHSGVWMRPEATGKIMTMGNYSLRRDWMLRHCVLNIINLKG